MAQTRQWRGWDINRVVYFYLFFEMINSLYNYFVRDWLLRLYGKKLFNPTSINVITYILSQKCEAPPPASMLCSCFGAVCVVTATLLHMHVRVRNHVSIQAFQVNSVIAEAHLLTAGAGLLHSSCCFRVP